MLGETLDIGIGNMLDKFARKFGHPFPGGPVIEQHARAYLEANPDASLKGLELPYAVRGMDMAFSGLMTAAVAMVHRGVPFEAVCWSLQEHAFAACVEVAERAMAHAENTSSSSVAASLAISASVTCVTSWPVSVKEAVMHHLEYCIDNGTMIAQLGWLELESGRTTRTMRRPLTPVFAPMRPRLPGDFAANPFYPVVRGKE